MKSIKKLITFGAISLAVVLLFAGTAIASSDGSRWDRVWAAIQDLQSQIANIQLIPGPIGPQGPAGVQGPQGATGSQGPQGIQGPAGLAGAELDRSRVYQRYTDLLPVVAHAPGTTAEIFCDDENDVLLNGGFFVSHNNVRPLASYGIFGVRAGWRVGAAIEGDYGGQVQASAQCYRVD